MIKFLSYDDVIKLSREKCLELLIVNTCNYEQIPPIREEFKKIFDYWNISEDEFEDLGGDNCYNIKLK